MRRGDRPPGIKRAKAPSAKTVRNIVGTLPGCSPTPSARAGRRATRPAPWTSRRPRRPRRSGGSTRRKSTPSPPPPPPTRTHLDRAKYLTAAKTGLRQGELVALLFRDIDWTAGAVRVRRNHVRRIDGTLKSRRSTRTVPMADDVARALEALAWDVDDSEAPWCSPTPSRAGETGPCGDPAPDAQGAQGRRARPVAPLPRPAGHVRHPDGGPRRADADVAGVDGARQHRDQAAVCRLRASARRAGACAGRVRATRDDATVVARLPVRRSADGPQAGWLARRSMFS